MCVYSTSEQVLLGETKCCGAEFHETQNLGDAYSPVALRHHQSYSNHLQAVRWYLHLALLL